MSSIRLESTESREIPIYITSGGLPKTGLTPVLSMYKKLSDGSNITPPAITEVGNGFYKFTALVGFEGTIIGLVDGGDVLASGDRYIPIEIVAGGYPNRLTEIRGTGWTEASDSLEKISDKIDSFDPKGADVVT